MATLWLMGFNTELKKVLDVLHALIQLAYRRVASGICRWPETRLLNCDLPFIPACAGLPAECASLGLSRNCFE